MNAAGFILWVAIPYAAIAVFIVGTSGATGTTSSAGRRVPLRHMRTRLLRWGSPMFHLGILMVIAGHVVGLLIPREWLYAIGISEEIYHFGATSLGTIAAILTLAGLAILIYRRRTVGPVFLATTAMDKVMYVFLGATLGFGTLATVVFQVFGSGFHYRETISPWIRSILFFQPQPELMTDVPLLFQIHVVTAFALFAQPVAVHASRARVLGTGRVPVPPLHRVPVP